MTTISDDFEQWVIKRRKFEWEKIGEIRGEAKGEAQSLKSLMKSLKINLDKAMELLNLPVSERAKYEKLISELD